ncbi:MAG: Arc family DNA-binding protein [Rhizobium sp.]|nr:MAG: Arc family DNA-binding protein [Rhizobium sp.]
MAKKTLVREYDKFMLRLPPGMRERIKAKADRAGMSMNEAIVWCLNHYFPAPVTIEERLEDLAEMVAILKGDDTYEGVDALVVEIQETLEQIASKKLETTPDFRGAVQSRFERWNEEEYERARDRDESPFDVESPTSDGDLPF